uniref:FHA domain-containing protein n=1 Tax=Panagrolaimus sp. ES5 TaxID=591445 RepID=A0AC34GS23_9BILA
MAVNKSISPAATASTKSENGPILILTPCHNSHEFIERRFVVPKNEENAVKIGRAVGRVLAAPNNAIFDCKVLSRNHAIVWLEDDSFFIKDTKSSNGTFINNSRLSNSGDESAPTPLASGDILQLGVEIVDNAKKVASGCIIAMVRFINSQGVEIATRRSASNANSSESMITERVPKHCLVVPEEQMYQMQQYVYEAKHREAALGQKLTILQEALKEAHEASETNWQAMINEERLLSRIEILESQLALLSTKNLTHSDLQTKIEEFCAEKERVETYTKDVLRKSTEEASEARLRFQESELALMNVEEQNNFIREKFQETEKELESQKYLYEKLQSNYEIVCQELEIARAANQHLILTAKKEKEAAAALQIEAESQDERTEMSNGDIEAKSDLETVMDDIIPPAPAPPSKEFADIAVQVETKELDPQLPVKKDLINLDELLSDKIDNSVIEANKENLQFLSETLNSIIDDPKSSAINPLTLQQAVTKTIISVAKKTHEIVEIEQKCLRDEKIAELTKTISNQQTSDKLLSSHSSNSNHNSIFSEAGSSDKSESSEEMISVFPLFSIIVLFLYKLWQILIQKHFISKKELDKPDDDDQSIKTGDEERNLMDNI